MKISFKNIISSILSFELIILIIGSGHLLMITIEHFDAKISVQEYSHPGRAAVWHGESSRQEELLKMIDKSKAVDNKERLALLQSALESLNNGKIFSFSMLQVSSFFSLCTLVAAILVLLILIFSRFIKHDALHSLTGLFAGFFVWITVEMGLIAASRQLGIARRFDIYNGDIIEIRGEFVLLKYSWVFLVPVLLYLLFQESVRCNMFFFFAANFI